jgi:hypothetical protein
MKNIKQIISTKPYFYVTQREIYEDGFDEVSREIEKLHRRTYLCLRSVMLIIAILLPLIFLVATNWVDMQDSISAFYHTKMRNIFVGALFAIGICLYVYKGYNDLENYALTVAGLLLFGVAMFPTSDPSGIIPWYFYITHYFCAIIFFVLLAVVCIWCRKTPYGESPNLYHKAYNITAGLMIILLGSALILKLLDKFGVFKFKTATFYVEWCAIWIFALYWCVKGTELKYFFKQNNSK